MRTISHFVHLPSITSYFIPLQMYLKLQFGNEIILNQSFQNFLN
uniref:Uncharacterized protein n=1 Tax=Brugia timori TaxID=42155 RepID=A0A0R3QT91_9BILA